MTYVSLREGESGDSLVRRFRIAVERSGILRDVRDHRFFRSKGQKARMAARLAIRRAARRARRQEA
ncbi:MAG: 30S ribosomal protein S21 [Chloroflexi bacterium]|nr:30S ribosomal protein S21 [Chloroflexota bacterium]